ncbi:MAG: DSD1 family PLP-dependent enzyme [Deltaproteobacteria bacterium]|jgi:D-serine deaminase-like pyridoxal phosphate-dependent protein|nr:DSD1 family PLP-dependent enzyme [Deltaproteobacteria bacterium]
MDLHAISTPAALIDVRRMRANIRRMQKRMDELGVALRPHAKTAKCLRVTRAQNDAGAQGITVSTLKEAEQFFAGGISDITYAVGVAPSKLPRALGLMRRGCALRIIADSVESARAIADFGQSNTAVFDVLIEIDTDGHRSGVPPEARELPGIAAALTAGGANLQGVLTHAGSSYDLSERAALEALAEQERALCVRAAERLRQAGYACPVVSVGSTPTALCAGNLTGVTEARAGVYVFFDLVMRNVGVCSMDDIALSVLTTVIGHRKEKGWAIVDAGWMAMSRDRGSARHGTDFGYGQICSPDGAPLPGYIVSGANQEHGIVSLSGGVDAKIAERFPLGSLLRVLPNHACATGAQFPEYYALAEDGMEVWPRFYGW